MKRTLITCMIMASMMAGGCNPKAQQANEGTEVLLETTMGDVRIRLYDQTPLHRDNFVKLINDGYYDEVLFHRVIKDFMVQTGDPDSRGAKAGQMLGSGGPDYTIDAEITPELFHKRGAVAAARQGDNVNPRRASSGSQFYIVWGQQYSGSMLDTLENRYGLKMTQKQREAYMQEGGTPHLDGAYTVFGEVVEGLDVVEMIQSAKTDMFDRPESDIKIVKASIAE